jgi:hypothetical protein
MFVPGYAYHSFAERGGSGDSSIFAVMTPLAEGCRERGDLRNA